MTAPLPRDPRQQQAGGSPPGRCPSCGRAMIGAFTVTMLDEPDRLNRIVRYIPHRPGCPALLNEIDWGAPEDQPDSSTWLGDNDVGSTP
jgi:hypothetical protein